MRRILLLLLIIVFLLTIPVDIVYADNGAEELKDSVNSTLDALDLSSIEEFVRDRMNADEVFFGTIKDYISSIINGDFKVSFTSVIDSIIHAAVGDVMSFLPLLITVIAISVLLSIIEGLSSKFASKGTSEIIYFVCYITVIVLVVTSVSFLLKDVTLAVNKMQDFMMIVFPILLTLMASLGSVVTVSAYKPLMAGLTYLGGTIVAKLVLPLFIASMIFMIVGNLSHNIKLDKMTSAAKSVGVFVLSSVFSIFMSLVTLQGITGAGIDNITIKSAKFAISSYVPILGGYLSDGFDIALASVVLIKNSLGAISIVIVLIMVLVPIIKIAVFILTLKITAGIVEPISDSRISEFLDGVAGNMSLLIAILLGMAFMFFVMAMLVILSLNVV